MRMRGAGTEPSMIEASCAERVFSLARSRWQFGRKQRRSGNERRSESALSLSHRGADSSDSRKLMDRIDQLEKRQRLLTAAAVRLREENRLLRREVKLLGDVVLEIYQLLYQLMGKKPPDSRIHSEADPS
jgi:hypothetical protein